MTAGEFWLAAGLMAAVTYATRLPGLLVRRPSQGVLGRALAAVPAAAFAALAAPPLLEAEAGLAVHPGALVPAAAAWLVTRRSGHAAAGLGAGVAAAVLMRAAGL